MQLKRAGSQPSSEGPAEFFTGTVRVDPLNTALAPSRVSCANVTFEPGARSAWHTHPLGQVAPSRGVEPRQVRARRNGC